MSDSLTVDKTGKSARSEAIDTRLVRRLADILKETGLSEIEVERHGLKIRVARETTLVAAAAAPMAIAAPAVLPMAAVAAAAPTPAPASAGMSETAPPSKAAAPGRPAGDEVKSPMVGTVYLQAQPGSPPFVRVGDTVDEGQTLLIIEAMKTMNPIPAPRGGKIVALLVQDGQPVEYGEALAVIG